MELQQPPSSKQPLTLTDPTRDDSGHGTAYTTLFEEDWNSLCTPSSIAAIDGPVAYLHTLYQFALSLESSGKGDRDKVTLDSRRPDLKTMQIDAQSLTALVSQLSILNETLTHQLENHLATAPDAFKGLSINEALRHHYYPYLLPFDRAHLQCQLCLVADKPVLGELNYRISLTLPLSQNAQNKYGVVLQEAKEAQLLLSGLSPSQQALLTASFEGPHTRGSPQRAGFFRQFYGAEESALHPLKTWLAHTQLSTDQAQALIARGQYLPRRSHNIANGSVLLGARYVNGHAQPEGQLDFSSPQSAGVRLLNTSFNRFERLHRMIRLQRWLQVAFDELDTLLWSVMQREQPGDGEFAITPNSLRALGVWRYLDRHHGLPIEAFAAILHELPTDAPSHRLSLYDLVFNVSELVTAPLLDSRTPLTLTVDDPEQASLRQWLCAGLHVQDAPDALQWLITQANHYLPGAPATLTVLSSLYRQARIAALFNLSIRDSHFVAHLLAGEAYTRQLVAPTLRDSGSNAPPDLLDVLMQMDWLTRWLKHSQQSVADLRRRLLMDDHAQTPKVRIRLEHLHSLVELIGSGLLMPSDIEDLQLPQPEPQTAKSPIRWHAFIVKGLLHSYPQLPENKIPREMPARMVNQLDSLVLSLDPNTDAELKHDAKTALNKKLAEFYQQLSPLKAKFAALFNDSASSYDPELLSLLLKHTSRLLAQASEAATPGPLLGTLMLMLPDAETLLELPVGRDVLHRFLLNPHWLDSDLKAGAPLPLSVKTLYLLQRFQHARRTYGLDEEALLDYLHLANKAAISAADADLRPQATDRLAALLGWAASEVDVLIQRTPTREACTVAHLDWLMRCQENARATGLSASTLLLATDLSGQVSSNAWDQVAGALIAAAQ